MWVYNNEPDWPTYKATVTHGSTYDRDQQEFQNSGPESVDVPFDVLLQNNGQPELYEALEFVYQTSRFTAKNFKVIQGVLTEGVEKDPCVVITEVRCHPLKLFFDEEYQTWEWTLTAAPKKISLIVALPMVDKSGRDEILKALDNEYKDKFGTYQGAAYKTSIHAGYTPRYGRRRLTSKRLYERLQGMHLNGD